MDPTNGRVELHQASTYVEMKVSTDVHEGAQVDPTTIEELQEALRKQKQKSGRARNRQRTA